MARFQEKSQVTHTILLIVTLVMLGIMVTLSGCASPAGSAAKSNESRYSSKELAERWRTKLRNLPADNDAAYYYPQTGSYVPSERRNQGGTYAPVPPRAGRSYNQRWQGDFDNQYSNPYPSYGSGVDNRAPSSGSDAENYYPLYLE